jgi:hypothetical protein
MIGRAGIFRKGEPLVCIKTKAALLMPSLLLAAFSSDTPTYT